MVDDGWVDEFCRILAPEPSSGLPDEVELHARAAATLRSFDRALLSEVMGERFSGRAFRELTHTPLVVSPRPSGLLDTGEAYRVRSFLRAFWRRQPDDREQVDRWHKTAMGHFEGLADSTPDEEHAFALHAEALFHRLCLDRESAAAELQRRFFDELERGRLDRCETLIEVARDLGAEDRAWLAEIEEMACRTYHGDGRYELAAEAFAKAKQLASDTSQSTDAALRAAQGLATCLRLLGRLTEAGGEASWVLERADGNLAARFQAVWTDSLVERELGRLERAQERAADARRLLDPLLRARNGDAEAAGLLGIGHLKRKPAHLLRHEAEIARRAGRYRTSARFLENAVSAYRRDPEPEAEALLEVVRAHLLRLEGDAARAIKRATRARAVLDRDEVGKPRSRIIALRCLVQAELVGSRPHDARALLQTLAELNLRESPRSVTLAHYGLGELDRLGGELSSARAHYRLARSATVGAEVFEHVYGLLGLVEVERQGKRVDQACNLIDSIDAETYAEHPLLSFWIALLGARAHAGRPSRAARRHTRRLLEQAAATLERFELRGGRHQPHDDYARTRAAIDAGEPLQPVRLLLP